MWPRLSFANERVIVTSFGLSSRLLAGGESCGAEWAEQATSALLSTLSGTAALTRGGQKWTRAARADSPSGRRWAKAGEGR
jgi:hypothetical protein